MAKKSKPSASAKASAKMFGTLISPPSSFKKQIPPASGMPKLPKKK